MVAGYKLQVAGCAGYRAPGAGRKSQNLKITKSAIAALQGISLKLTAFHHQSPVMPV
jgi:hypothetical protein